MIRYTRDHEWVRLDGNVATVGISNYAQAQLGDVVYVELPETGKAIEKGKEAAVVESVKAASEVFAPISGTVLEVNAELTDNPALVNEDPEGKGWFVKLHVPQGTSDDGLLDENDYKAFLETREILMRYHPLTPTDRADMLARIGVGAVDDLFSDVPADKLLPGLLDLPKTKGEAEVERLMGRMAARNTTASSVPFFVGAGAYKHHVPATVDHLIQRSEFLTSYTPYQPEITQGTLQYLFEFQTQVAALTGMEVANASMYDGSTGTGEAVLMAHRLTRRNKAVLSGGLHPQYRAVVETLSDMAGDVVAALPPDPLGAEDILAAIDKDTSCVVVQSPNFFGEIIDLAPIAEKAHQVGALLVAVVTEIVSLGLIEPPGAQGADIVVAEGQSIGNPLGFGGPYVGLFATRQKFIRQMPGRLCGETVDAEGRRGFVLTLSTREQHIRRDKATSNICTNSGLCCLAFTIHMTLLGEAGLTRLARLNHEAAVKLADRLAAVPGVEVLGRAFFNEFTIRVPGDAIALVEGLAEKGVLGGVPAARLLPGEGLDDLIVVAATEINTDEDRAAYAAALEALIHPLTAGRA